MSSNYRSVRVFACLIWYAFLASPGEAADRWARTYSRSGEDKFQAVQQTADGGYILAGSTYSAGGTGYDGWCVRLDASGDVAWQKTFGGFQVDFLQDMQVTADGGYILAGCTNSFGDGGYDAWCLRLDSSGNTVWEKTYGASLDESAFAVDVTPDGGFFLAGVASSFGSGSNDAWCLRLNAVGTPLWQRTYGGPSSDFFSTVRATADGGCVLAGSTQAFGAGGSDAWCTRLDASGNLIWQNTYGGALVDSFGEVEVAADGDYILAGTSMSFGGGLYVAWCLRLDATGFIVWQRTYGAGPIDYLADVEVTADDGCLVVGSTYSGGAGNQDAWCLKLDGSGNITWLKTYGGTLNDVWYAVQATADGGYVLAGVAASFGAGDPDAFCAKVDSLVSKKLSVDTKWQNVRVGEILRTPLRKAGREECRNGAVISGAQGGI
ncbi:MAG: hypothetical protein HYX75_12195, partial [Acidobacteria bacterium]|nr:hypothetical protein [Acidobacteriota bacterium]